MVLTWGLQWANPRLQASFRRLRRARRPVRAQFMPQVMQLEERCLLDASLIKDFEANISQMKDNQAEGTIAIDPTDPLENHLFAASNTSPVGQGNPAGLFAATTTNGGKTWTGRTIATGYILPGEARADYSLPAACCDPKAAFDRFGNLFLTYLTEPQLQIGTITAIGAGNVTLTDANRTWDRDEWVEVLGDQHRLVVITSGPAVNEVREITGNTSQVLTVDRPWIAPRIPRAGDSYVILGSTTTDPSDGARSVEVIRSTDGGRTFEVMESLETGRVDQPSIATGPARAVMPPEALPPESVWVTWQNRDFSISAAGTEVDGYDQVNLFQNPKVVPSSLSGNFGDIKIGPEGQVVVTYQKTTEATPFTSDNVSARSNGPPTLSVAGMPWTDNQWRGSLVRITRGVGAGQFRRITGNNGNMLMLAGLDWAPLPAVGARFLISAGATGGTATTLEDTSHPTPWNLNQFTGQVVQIIAGRGANQDADKSVRGIVSNTANSLTVDRAWEVGQIPDNSSNYVITASSRGPEPIFTAAKPDGLADTDFRDPVLVTNTNVGTFLPIPAQRRRKIDAEASLAWDRTGNFGDPVEATRRRNGRIYLAYTDRSNLNPDSNDTDIFLQSSDDLGATWVARGRILPGERQLQSRFLPAVAVDQNTGVLAITWYDAREDRDNIKAGIYGTVSINGGDDFLPSKKISAGLSSSALADSNKRGTTGRNAATTLADANKGWIDHQWVGATVRIIDGTATGETRQISDNTATVLTVTPPWTNGGDIIPPENSLYQIFGGLDALDFGDYTGLDFLNGAFYPIWADNSNSTGDNADLARGQLDLYTSRIVVVNQDPAGANPGPQGGNSLSFFAVNPSRLTNVLVSTSLREAPIVSATATPSMILSGTQAIATTSTAQSSDEVAARARATFINIDELFAGASLQDQAFLFSRSKHGGSDLEHDWLVEIVRDGSLPFD